MSEAHRLIANGQQVVIGVTISHDLTTGWSASSDDLPGFRAIESSREALIELCRDMIAATFSADCGVETNIRDQVPAIHAFVVEPHRSEWG